MFKHIQKGNYIRYFSQSHDWTLPTGHDTGIKIYNCVTKTKVPLIVKDQNLTKWYSCGPTVYDSSHIGHGACYTKLDIIQNILKKYFKLNLVTVMNITDIDDKIIKRSNELKLSTTQIANKYEKEFFSDLSLLQVQKPDIIVRVSENINLIIKFIDQLIKKKYAYKSGDSVYFDVTKYNNYGKLQNVGDINNKTGVKKSSADFALWKGSKPDEPFWESPWGNGRPGWHIECSALATHLFGSNFDVHAGGIDLRFPHHENEEAQSCAFHDNNQWVNYWLHTGHLHLKNDEKMSKSLKNTISIQQMLKNVKPEEFRMACLMSHYRSFMEYSDDFILTSRSYLNKYKNFITACNEFKNGTLTGTINSDILRTLLEDTSNKIHHSLCDDFDTPSVIKCLNEAIGTVNSMLHSSGSSTHKKDLVYVTAFVNLLVNTLDIFNLSLKDQNNLSDHTFVEVMDILNNFRQDVRTLGLISKNKEVLILCDNVRNNLGNHGIVVKDHGKVSTWSK